MYAIYARYAMYVPDYGAPVGWRLAAATICPFLER